MSAPDTLTSIMGLVRADALPDDPAKIDLRFFREIHFADTYNGVGYCSDGVEYSAILYGNKVVWQFAIYRDYNNVKHRQPFDGNNELYYRMFKVAQPYLQIVEICRIKYFGKELPKGAGNRWDHVFLAPQVLSSLEEHPQYQKVKASFGLTLRQDTDKFFYLIGCSKRESAA